MNLDRIQEALREAGIEAWLFYDLHHRDRIGYRILGLAPQSMCTRRWFYVIPAHGEPRKLVHRIESGQLDPLPGPAPSPIPGGRRCTPSSAYCLRTSPPLPCNTPRSTSSRRFRSSTPERWSWSASWARRLFPPPICSSNSKPAGPLLHSNRIWKLAATSIRSSTRRSMRSATASPQEDRPTSTPSSNLSSRSSTPTD